MHFTAFYFPPKRLKKLDFSARVDADSTAPTTVCAAEAVCALAQRCAPERRLTLTGVNDFPGIHTSFPCSFLQFSG